MPEALPNTETENLNKTFEEKFKVFTNKLISSAPLLCGIGIAIWWIFYGMVEIVPTVMTIEQRIGLTVCTIFIAIIYCNLISVGGFKSAKKDHDYVIAARQWTDAIKKGNPHKAEIIEYAKDIARANQKEARIQNLENVGVNYSEVFDENGELIRLDYDKKYHKTKNPNGYLRGQIKMIKHCINIRIVIPEMFGNISSKFFGIQERASQKKYETKNIIKNGLIRALVSFFTVGISFAWLGLSWSAVIYAIFQIVMWTGSGVLERMKNYNFIIDKILPQIVENTLIINGYLDLSSDKKVIYENKAKEEQEKRERKLIPVFN